MAKAYEISTLATQLASIYLLNASQFNAIFYWLM